MLYPNKPRRSLKAGSISKTIRSSDVKAIFPTSLSTTNHARCGISGEPGQMLKALGVGGAAQRRPHRVETTFPLFRAALDEHLLQQVEEIRGSEVGPPTFRNGNAGLRFGYQPKRPRICGSFLLRQEGDGELLRISSWVRRGAQRAPDRSTQPRRPPNPAKIVDVWSGGVG